MRRRVRDSIVGFSLLGGFLIFTFFSFWLRGVRLSSKNWHLYAEFNNASGLSKKEIERVEPLIKEITIAANHLNNILSTIDDKETLNDIKLTINAARSISTKIDDMSDDFEKLTQDKELTKSIRDLTIGLSKFLNEIYP